MDLNLKIVLVSGPMGKWEVQWAGIVDKPNSNDQTLPTKDKAQAVKPIVKHKRSNANAHQGPLSVAQAHKMEPRWVWKPKPSLHKTQDLAETSGTTKPSTREDQESAVTTPKSHILTDPVSQPEEGEQNDQREMVTELLVPDQCWGNTGEWFLELKDGQRLRLSMELRSPMIDPDAQVDDISPQMLQWSNPFREGLRDFSNGSKWGLRV